MLNLALFPDSPPLFKSKLQGLHFLCKGAPASASAAWSSPSSADGHGHIASPPRASVSSLAKRGWEKRPHYRAVCKAQGSVLRVSFVVPVRVRAGPSVSRRGEGIPGRFCRWEGVSWVSERPGADPAPPGPAPCPGKGDRTVLARSLQV